MAIVNKLEALLFRLFFFFYVLGCMPFTDNCFFDALDLSFSVLNILGCLTR